MKAKRQRKIRMNFSKKLINLFESEDGKLFEPEKKIKKIDSNDRLTLSFKEITEFVNESNRMPELTSKDLKESLLAKRLNQLIADDKKVDKLKSIDYLGLLKLPKPPKSVEELFEKDSDLFTSEGNKIFNLSSALKNKKIQINRYDDKAKRKKVENFDLYKPKFIEQQKLLAEGKRKLTLFDDVEMIKIGGFYVQDGVLLYVESFGKIDRKIKYKQQRLRVIYENGTESNMYRRSLAQRLYEGCFTVVDNNYVGEKMLLSDDKIRGYIYILKSLSDKDNIRTIKDLYKIGYSTTPIFERIKDAQNDPTYLMAHVQVIDSFIITNDYNPEKIEFFIHRFFSDAKIEMEIIDKNGRKYIPQEWYSVPLGIVRQAVSLLDSGDIVDYIYDGQLQKIKILSK